MISVKTYKDGEHYVCVVNAHGWTSATFYAKTRQEAWQKGLKFIEEQEIMK